MKTLLCTLKNGIAVYKGDMLNGFESPADRVEVRVEGSDPVETNEHLVFENDDHVLISSSNAEITDQYLIALIELTW